jgi:hypothetical protein
MLKDVKLNLNQPKSWSKDLLVKIKDGQKMSSSLNKILRVLLVMYYWPVNSYHTLALSQQN